MRQITLAIEASNPSSGGAGVALGEGSDPASARLLGIEALRDADRHDDDLMPAIDRLARRLGVGPRQITRVACSVGPGGYTGVRIGVATAKMIAEAVGAACVGVPTARVVARRVEPAGRAFGVALASKNDTAFVATFDDAGRETDAGGVVAAGDLARAGIALLVADRFLPESFRSEAARLGITVVAPRFDASACFEESLTLPGIDPIALVPVYPREPDAVTQWRKRKHGSKSGPAARR